MKLEILTDNHKPATTKGSTVISHLRAASENRRNPALGHKVAVFSLQDVEHPTPQKMKFRPGHSQTEPGGFRPKPRKLAIGSEREQDTKPMPPVGQGLETLLPQYRVGHQISAGQNQTDKVHGTSFSTGDPGFIVPTALSSTSPAANSRQVPTKNSAPSLSKEISVNRPHQGKRSIPSRPHIKQNSLSNIPRPIRNRQRGKILRHPSQPPQWSKVHQNPQIHPEKAASPVAALDARKNVHLKHNSPPQALGHQPPDQNPSNQNGQRGIPSIADQPRRPAPGREGKSSASNPVSAPKHASPLQAEVGTTTSRHHDKPEAQKNVTTTSLAAKKSDPSTGLQRAQYQPSKPEQSNETGVPTAKFLPQAASAKSQAARKLEFGSGSERTREGFDDRLTESLPSLQSAPVGQPDLQQHSIHVSHVSAPRIGPSHQQVVMSQVIDALVRNNGNSVDISLEPAELGRVRLSLHLSQETMTVHVLADRAETLDLMRKNSAVLHAELVDLGFQDVSFSFSDNRKRQNAPNPNPPTVELTEASNIVPALNTAGIPTPAVAQPDTDHTLDLRL